MAGEEIESRGLSRLPAGLPLYGETLASSRARPACSRKSSIRFREIRDWLNTSLVMEQGKEGKRVGVKDKSQHAPGRVCVGPRQPASNVNSGEYKPPVD